MTASYANGPLAADASVRNIARDGRSERPSAAQHQNSLHLPSAQHASSDGICVRQEPVALAERQFITRAGGEVLWNVECRQRALICIIAAHRWSIRHADALRP